MDIVKNLNSKFIEKNLSIVVDRMLYLGVRVLVYVRYTIKVILCFTNPLRDLVSETDISECAFKIS